jgi:hypothetical protein
MSDEDDRRAAAESEPGNEPAQGVNLKLIYSLIALALVVAIAVAVMIVLPFYRAR